MTDIMDWQVCKRVFIKELEVDPAKISALKDKLFGLYFQQTYSTLAHKQVIVFP